MICCKFSNVEPSFNFWYKTYFSIRIAVFHPQKLDISWCRSTKQTLQWRHNGRDSVSNHQLHHCLLDRLFRRRSKKTSKLRVTGLRAENSPVIGEFPAQRASYAENVSIWWRHQAEWCTDAHHSFMTGGDISAPSQYPIKRLIVRSRKDSKPRDWWLKSLHRFEISQTHQQHCCRSACQSSEPSC